MFNFFYNTGNYLIIDDLTKKIQSDIYLTWEFPRIVEKDFTCQYCGKKKNIHVEYDISDLRNIVEEVNTRLNPSNRDSYDVKRRVQKAVVEEITQLNNIDYLVLCESCS